MSITSLKITQGAEQLDLTWDLTSTSGKAIVVMWSPHGKNEWSSTVLAASATSYTITGLTAGQEYDVDVDYVSAEADKTGTPVAPTPAPPTPAPPAPAPPTPNPTPVVEPGNGLATGPIAAGGEAWSDTLSIPVPGAVIPTANFGGWTWWGQGQGGPGSTIPNPSSGDDIYGTMTTETPAAAGIPAPPNDQPYVGSMTVTASQMAHLGDGQTGVSAKLYKYFQTNGKSPSDVSGTYSAYYYVPANFVIPAPSGNVGEFGVNVFQFKELNSSGQSNPLWWIQFAPYGWLKNPPTPSRWVGTEPGSDSAATLPIAYLSYEGNDYKRDMAMMAVPLGRWFEISCVLDQSAGTCTYSIAGTLFDTADASTYPIAPFTSGSVAWFFGIGNYSNTPNTLYIADASFTPAA